MTPRIITNDTPPNDDGLLNVFPGDDVTALTTARRMWACRGSEFPSLTSADHVLAYAGSKFPALTTAGYVFAHGGAEFPALKTVSTLQSYEGAKFPALVGWRLLSDGPWYQLWRRPDGLYCAGCVGPLTLDQALAHWGPRNDARAIAFTAALKKETQQ
jgi:hypothetical protein